MIGHADWHVGADGHPGSALRQCLLAATTAPSIHNTQPWRFRVRRGGIDVYADQSRRLGVVDPDGREVLLSVGAALFNLRIAILAGGRMPKIRLLAGTEHTQLAASVDIGHPIRASDTVRMLNRAIPRRRTNRRPFSEAGVPPDTLAECARACAAEGGHLTFLDAGTTEAVLGLVRIAERYAHAAPSYWTEIASWTRRSSNRRDGVPPEAYGPWSAMNAVPIRDFGLIEPARRRRVEIFESEPTVAVLHSRDDSPRGWLQAGQALERTLLTATVRGVATTLMTQPLELPCLRQQIARTAEGLAPQAIVRFGYGPPSPATPRRPLEEVVEAPDASRHTRGQAG